MANIPEKPTSLPPEIWRQVAKFFDGKDFTNAKAVSQVFHAIMESDTTWMHLAHNLNLPIKKDPQKSVKAQVIEYYNEANKILEEAFPNALKDKKLDPIAKHAALRNYLLKEKGVVKKQLSSIILKLHALNPVKGSVQDVLLNAMLVDWAEYYREYDYTALARAIEESWPIPLLEKLIKYMAPENIENSITAYTTATKNNNLELIKFLLNAGVKNLNDMALFRAIGDSNKEMVKLLLTSFEPKTAMNFKEALLEAAKDKPEILTLIKDYFTLLSQPKPKDLSL